MFSVVLWVFSVALVCLIPLPLLPREKGVKRNMSIIKSLPHWEEPTPQSGGLGRGKKYELSQRNTEVAQRNTELKNI
jgi:hypothetical protein